MRSLLYLMLRRRVFFIFFFFNDTATTEIYTLSLHDALPIFKVQNGAEAVMLPGVYQIEANGADIQGTLRTDRKSTRLNSSHSQISYAVFCLKKKKTKSTPISPPCRPLRAMSLR